MALSCATAEDVLKTIKDEKVQMIDLRFTDLPGIWQHFSVPPSAVDADALDEGIGFDGSSIRGFQEIQESDMLVVPDPTTAFLDPFTTAPTLVLVCNVRDPVTGQTYTRDPRYVAQKAETYLKSTGLGEAGRAEALYVCGDPLVTNNRIRIINWALGARLPTMHGSREHVEAGGLMSYGPTATPPAESCLHSQRSGGTPGRATD
jgi:Glutamine synthetase, beta-Grasp domain